MAISNLSYLLYFSLLYICGLSILYYSKMRINNIENRIYKWLLGLNLAGIILQICCDFVSAYYEIVPIIISELTLRLYLAYFIAWINTMLDYLLAIIFIKKRKIIWINILFTIIECLIVIILPFNLFRDVKNKIYYTFGTAINMTFTLSGILIVIMLILIIFNIKKIRNGKIIPIFLFMIFGMIAVIIQKYNPSLIIIAPMETFICSLMYFTIENPDVKMLQEVEFAREQAEKANHAKTDFLSSMSHEIRTPLNAIVGFSQALLEEEIPNSAKEEVEDIISASNTLLELVNSILDISKIEANKIEIIEKEYSFKEVYNELIALTKARLGEKGLEFSCSYDESIPPVLYGDHVRIKQIILNLLTNSVKYTKQGFIDFKVSSFKQNGICRLIISVEDSGIGIKQENIDKLFTKFERFDEKNTTIEGTGLGLAITKKLIDLMSGKIIVQSLYKKGSKFTVILDQKIIDKKSLEPVINKEEPKSANLTEKRILIVDDNSLNLKVAARLLATYKMQVDTCLSGEECISKIEAQEKYDLIFLDDMMPKLSGVETLKKLKERKDFCIPTIALTANAITGMREKYLSDGFDDYLSKPIEKEELNRIIQKFLQK